MAGTQFACGVCDEKSDAFHFGAFSCNACAAFFRRIVSSNQTPKVQCSGNCDLTNHILRRMCPSCRYDKCLKIGMKPSAVQSKRAKSDEVPESILEELKQSYEHLRELRRHTFKNETSKLTFFEEMDEVVSIDINLILDTMMKKFTKLAPMTDDQHRCLITNFLVLFIIADQCFRSIDSDYTILANGNYVDVRNTDQHYQSTSGVVDENRVARTSMFLAPYWRLGRGMMFRRFTELRIDLNEFMLFLGLIYWDFGLPDQTDECIEICLGMRTRIFEELKNYEQKKCRNDGFPLRIGEIMLLLQMVQKYSTVMQEYKTIAIVYDLCAKHCPLFQIV